MNTNNDKISIKILVMAGIIDQVFLDSFRRSGL